MEAPLAEAETKVAESEAVLDVVASARYSRVNSRFEQFGLSGADGAPVPIRAGGLITSTLLTLLVLPAIYSTFAGGAEGPAETPVRHN